MMAIEDTLQFQIIYMYEASLKCSDEVGDMATQVHIDVIFS